MTEGVVRRPFSNPRASCSSVRSAGCSGANATRSASCRVISVLSVCLEGARNAGFVREALYRLCIQRSPSRRTHQLLNHRIRDNRSPPRTSSSRSPTEDQDTIRQSGNSSLKIVRSVLRNEVLKHLRGDPRSSEGRLHRFLVRKEFEPGGASFAFRVALDAPEPLAVIGILVEKHVLHNEFRFDTADAL
jgi:hypothetical protein